MNSHERLKLSLLNRAYRRLGERSSPAASITQRDAVYRVRPLTLYSVAGLGSRRAGFNAAPEGQRLAAMAGSIRLGTRSTRQKRTLSAHDADGYFSRRASRLPDRNGESPGADGVGPGREHSGPRFTGLATESALQRSLVFRHHPCSRRRPLASLRCGRCASRRPRSPGRAAA